MKDKITELTYQNLAKMDKATFKRLFKKPMPWQKATDVLLFAKQKMTNGKLPLVVKWIWNMHKLMLESCLANSKFLNNREVFDFVMAQ